MSAPTQFASYTCQSAGPADSIYVGGLDAMLCAIHLARAPFVYEVDNKHEPTPR